MNCIDLMSKRSKQPKTTKAIKLRWIASIWCPNDQNNPKLQKRSNCHELHAFDIKTNENVALGRKPFKTTQNYKDDQNTMTWTDLASKRAKMSRYVAKHSKQRKTAKVIKLQWIASIWIQNDQKCCYVAKHSNQLKTTKAIKLELKTSKKWWVTSQTIQNL